MEENTLVLELSNGSEVKLHEVWICCGGHKDCGSVIEVLDCETGAILALFNGALPDLDDEDFDRDKYIKRIESEISWAENY